MTFTNLKLQVASDLGYTDDAGVILTGKDITETDIGKWINNRYIYDLFPALSSQYPEDYIIDSVSANYSRNAHVTTNVTTSLVLDDVIFVSGDVGNYVYNEDTEESCLITGYTSTSEVILDHATGWTALDDIIILEREVTLGGDATDANVVPRVEVKYSSTGQYVNCKIGEYNDLFESGDETYSQYEPRFYLTSNKTAAGVITSAIGITPVPNVPLTDAIKIKYVEIPVVMSADGDKPRLPHAFHKLLIMGATADAYKRLGMTAEGRSLEADYQMMKQMEVSTYPLSRASGPSRTKASRSISQFSTRAK